MFNDQLLKLGEFTNQSLVLSNYNLRAKSTIHPNSWNIEELEKTKPVKPDN